jgi:hypothetical protein
VERHCEKYKIGRVKRRLNMVANPTSKREMKERLSSITNPDEGFQVTDIEDLIARIPPCLRAVVVKQNRFPKHMERLRMLQTFQAAGMSYNSAARYFEQSNERHPHPVSHYRDAKARFNYEEAWKANKGAVYCGNLVRNAVLTPGSDVLKCPFVSTLKGKGEGKNYKPLLEPCKRACAKACGTRPGFKGPHHLIERTFLFYSFFFNRACLEIAARS